MKKHTIIIIGAGASGVLCAILLKQAGLDCALVDSQDRILKKLLTTGNGRCNLSNANLIHCTDFTPYFSTSDPDFDWGPLKQFGVQQTLELFTSLGLPTRTLEEGKIYPMSLQASSVSDLLRLRLEELQVPIYAKARVKSIRVKTGFQLSAGEEEFRSDYLVFASGGQAMPASGSDGSAYKLIRELGHEIIKPLPALVQLTTDFKQLRALSGVKGICGITLLSEGSEVYRETGELLFTDYGISGPPVLQMSRFASPLLDDGQSPHVRIDLFPELPLAQVSDLLKTQIRRFPHRQAEDLLNGIINKKLIPVLFKASGLEKMTTRVRDIPPDVVARLLHMMTAWEMGITGTNGFANSQSTLGGVSLKAVHQDTLESKGIPRLYFTGEVLDVCGACGGYNLQWAWSSAMAAAAAIREDRGRA